MRVVFAAVAAFLGLVVAAGAEEILLAPAGDEGDGEALAAVLHEDTASITYHRRVSGTMYEKEDVSASLALEGVVNRPVLRDGVFRIRDASRDVIAFYEVKGVGNTPVVVEEGVSALVVLNGAYIGASGRAPPFSLETGSARLGAGNVPDSEVTLLLAAGSLNVLDAGNTPYAALCVPAKVWGALWTNFTRVTITGGGTLFAKGGTVVKGAVYSGAGVGGNGGLTASGLYHAESKDAGEVFLEGNVAVFASGGANAQTAGAYFASAAGVGGGGYSSGTPYSASSPSPSPREIGGIKLVRVSGGARLSATAGGVVPENCVGIGAGMQHLAPMVIEILENAQVFAAADGSGGVGIGLVDNFAPFVGAGGLSVTIAGNAVVYAQSGSAVMAAGKYSGQPAGLGESFFDLYDGRAVPNPRRGITITGGTVTAFDASPADATGAWHYGIHTGGMALDIRSQAKVLVNGYLVRSGGLVGLPPSGGAKLSVRMPGTPFANPSNSMASITGVGEAAAARLNALFSALGFTLWSARP